MVGAGQWLVRSALGTDDGPVLPLQDDLDFVPVFNVETEVATLSIDAKVEFTDARSFILRQKYRPNGSMVPEHTGQSLR